MSIAVEDAPPLSKGRKPDSPGAPRRWPHSLRSSAGSRGISIILIGLILFPGLVRDAWAGEIRREILPECPRCNLILLNIDLLRPDHVGLLSPDVELTPAIDRFFSRGLIFEDMSSSSGATYVSATATATGTEAMFNTHGIRDVPKPGGGSWRIPWIVKRDGTLPVDRMPTIAQTLSESGYHTIALNEWIHSGERVNLDRGFAEYMELPLFGSLFGDQIDKIEVLLRRQNARRKPFYLYFHSNALHFKLHFPSDRVTSDPEFGALLRVSGERKNGTIVFDTWQDGLPQETIWEAYAEQIRYIDEQLERLFQLLERSHSDDTIVALYANHGTDIKDGKLGVGLPYHAYLHVPLLIRHPHVHRETRVAAMTSLVDLAPTLYDFLGISPLVPLTTRSMRPLLENGEPVRKYAFSRDIQFESVRNREWKLVISGGIDRSLYRLEDTPVPENDFYEMYLPVARNLEAAMIRERVRQKRYTAMLREFFQ